MTRRLQTTLLTAILALPGGLAAAQAQPPPCRGPGGWGAHGPYQGTFDPKAVQTIDGTIVAVDRIAGPGAWKGVNLRIRSARETVEVHLGPAWFVDGGEIALAAGDKVQIQASRVKVQGKPVLIAMTLSKGDMTLRLRDVDGFPYWAGWRSRSARRPGPGPAAPPPR